MVPPAPAPPHPAPGRAPVALPPSASPCRQDRPPQTSNAPLVSSLNSAALPTLAPESAKLKESCCGRNWVSQDAGLSAPDQPGAQWFGLRPAGCALEKILEAAEAPLPGTRGRAPS